MIYRERYISGVLVKWAASGRVIFIDVDWLRVVRRCQPPMETRPDPHGRIVEFGVVKLRGSRSISARRASGPLPAAT
jgi:hypothetical protein